MSNFEVVITDIEGDNLLEHITKFHCATIMDVYTEEYREYRPWDVQRYLEDLYNARVHINHHILGFDFPALEKLFQFKWSRNTCWDTLVVSRTLFPDRPGGHSLKSLGRSLGVLKGDFGETDDWSVFTEDMMKYNTQDCVVTRAILLDQMKKTKLTMEEIIKLLEGNNG